MTIETVHSDWSSELLENDHVFKSHLRNRYNHIESALINFAKEIPEHMKSLVDEHPLVEKGKRLLSEWDAVKKGVENHVRYTEGYIDQLVKEHDDLLHEIYLTLKGIYEDKTKVVTEAIEHLEGQK